MKLNTIFGALAAPLILSAWCYGGEKAQSWQDRGIFDGTKAALRQPIENMPSGKKSINAKESKDHFFYQPIVDSDLIFSQPVIDKKQNDFKSADPIFGMPAIKPSSLQRAIGQCVTIMVYRPIVSAQDLITVYAPCLKENSELKITGLYAHSAKNRLVVLSAAEGKVIESMKGVLTLKNGAFSSVISVEAYPDQKMELLKP